MRLGHISDLHYGPRHLEEADRCTAAALATMQDARVEAIAITGDGFDHQLDANHPAFLALCKRLREAADHAPLLYLQGTLSHDFPGTVAVFRLLGGQYPIHVSDRIEQVAWDGERFVPSDEWSPSTGDLPRGTRVLYTCVPSINRAQIAAKLGAEGTALQAREVVGQLLRSFALSNGAARACGIPTVLLSHGTVAGSVTEHGVPMAGLDHEFGLADLFASGASAILLGHIHKRQTWIDEGRTCGYAGSVGRLHFGEAGSKGGLIWDVDANGSSTTAFDTPSRRMVDIEFAGMPDMEELARRAANLDGAHVRVIWNVDAEHRNAIDRDAILSSLHLAAAVKLDGRVNPILRSRAEGIARCSTLAQQLEVWAKATETDISGLPDRLARLESEPAEAITALIVRAVVESAGSDIRSEGSETTEEKAAA